MQMISVLEVHQFLSNLGVIFISLGVIGIGILLAFVAWKKEHKSGD